MESNFKIPGSKEKKAYLVEKDMPADKLVKVLKKANEERGNGKQVVVLKMNKNKKFQKEQLNNEGYADIEEFFADRM